jgi:putative endonuclease
MKQANRQRGREGEERARQYLEALGWKLVAQNFYTKWGEIDLIMDDGQKLIFVEVKMKNTNSPGSPEEMINNHKIHQIVNTAGVFIRENPDWNTLRPEWRIDAVCIFGEELKHYQNISG